MYYSTKTYGNERGLSCCFRQWKADSHCHLLHGYSIGVKLIFMAEKLDSRNWVQDFGGLKEFEQWLKSMFDHTLIIAKDDPNIDTFLQLERQKLADLRVVDAVGCESFALMCYEHMKGLLKDERVKLKSVEVFEHGANSAIYENPELLNPIEIFDPRD